ncbi:glycosyltransferase family 4 protein [Roseovarius arcticus]|uniref:glycosyltransferase family 4 protein n=1 Tax=Roseovarius arcticus TaxID=2547404 RepID=UPI0011100499|nr:glycosyltransferase [Roseovarius arcticus]
MLESFNPRLRLLIVAPSLDGNDIGEVEWAFNWTEALSRQADVTVLATARIGAVPLALQLPAARVITWPEPAFLYKKFERFNALAKPSLPFFNLQVRRWMRRARARGETFDIGHQLLPQAMRYATALRGSGIPYVVGPLGGALNTPTGFRDEVRQSTSFASRLRALDHFRLRHDPWLRASYAGADLVLGVAPYVAGELRSIPIQRFHATLERGYDTFPPERVRYPEPGRLNLLHVGRVVRTKGLRDVVRAMAQLRDLPGVRLTSAGDGEDLSACKAEAERLGVTDQITFLGRISRGAVEEEYAKADVFCFPSFREPMGGVFFEAMAHGLAVIAASRGGPDFIIDESCGIRLAVKAPGQFSSDIAAAIRDLAGDPRKCIALGAGARKRLKSFGSWDDRAAEMINQYHEILAARAKEEP